MNFVIMKENLLQVRTGSVPVDVIDVKHAVMLGAIP
jgi:hypothetical protein